MNWIDIVFWVEMSWNDILTWIEMKWIVVMFWIGLIYLYCHGIQLSEFELNSNICISEHLFIVLNAIHGDGIELSSAGLFLLSYQEVLG